MSTMSPTVQGIFYLVAVVLFLVAAVAPTSRLNVVALGLGFFVFVAMWNAFAAA